MNDIKLLASKTIDFAQSIFGNDFIPLHRPIFLGNEKEYLIECIDSNFVSSVGQKVTDFEDKTAEFIGSKYAVATVNGTAALQVAIELSGVNSGDEILTQALTFVATCNAISYAGASPVFIDVDKESLGMSFLSLKIFLESNAVVRHGICYNKNSGKKISACIPMHTYGFPCEIKEISDICKEWNIFLIEDAAESLGSYVGNKHTGTFGNLATLSFNGNKVITTGGGGMIITDDEALAKLAKHKTTTAKLPHAYEYVHDQIGYNDRMPKLNAALGCAQIEKLKDFLLVKAKLANMWEEFFLNSGIKFVNARKNNRPNYWLNTIILNNRMERDAYLEATNANGVMTRPAWELMSNLKMYKKFENDGLLNSIWLQDRIVNIPSSVPYNFKEKL